MIACLTEDVEMNGTSDIGDKNSKGIMPAQGAVAVGVQELGQKTTSVPTLQSYPQQQQQQYPNYLQVSNNNQRGDHFHQQPLQHYAQQQAANQYPNYLQVSHQPRHNEEYNEASRSNNNDGMSSYIIAQSSNPLALVKLQDVKMTKGPGYS
eukprot:CAMPEP_0175055796 /NCGR_PEP_ID=MMETSP0052_2-20121109/10291_1 /TAXON_ID=51329 ORGANISM="Polytomella parva, Strain SAG 63-3" /NCGR_SAMPLE_ID=MMETSP0052_2 /ASSEMBLY_ACC=CAM_ASM_000194 /LENGTH=150 /DNA_ID=CAMNT_0016320705 /DNA_START=928 /DNA_END=1380 /DNA_ORIENTATION=-